jgi:hypothetical protein
MQLKLYKGVCGSGGIAPLILNMGARWRLMISFKTWMHYSRRSLLYLLKKRLVVPQSQDGLPCSREFRAHAGIRAPDPKARSPVTVSTNLGFFKNIPYFPPHETPQLRRNALKLSRYFCRFTRLLCLQRLYIGC